MLTPTTIARAQGAANVLGGVWPLVHLRSFERVFGPKVDEWLVYTVAGLLVVNGWAQLRATNTGAGQDHARRLGVGTALTLLAIEAVYVPKGRISKAYLLDSAVETGWIAAWTWVSGAGRSRAGSVT